jgi:hypothetical protein
MSWNIILNYVNQLYLFVKYWMNDIQLQDILVNWKRFNGVLFITT